MAGVGSPLRRCTRTARLLWPSAAAHARASVSVELVITLSPGVRADGQISADERQSSVQSLTDKRGLLTRVDHSARAEHGSLPLNSARVSARTGNTRGVASSRLLNTHSEEVVVPVLKHRY